jgi:hypothetical protein
MKKQYFTALVVLGLILAALPTQASKALEIQTQSSQPNCAELVKNSIGQYPSYLEQFQEFGTPTSSRDDHQQFILRFTFGVPGTDSGWINTICQLDRQGRLSACEIVGTTCGLDPNADALRFGTWQH